MSCIASVEIYVYIYIYIYIYMQLDIALFGVKTKLSTLSEMSPCYFAIAHAH